MALLWYATKLLGKNDKESGGCIEYSWTSNLLGNFLKATKIHLVDIPRFIKYDMQYFFTKTSSYIYYKQVK